MPISHAQMDDMLRVELARPEVQYARAQLASLLHEPRSCLMEWQYSDEGPFEAWVVGRSGDGEIELVWCDQGLGEGAYRWGAILVSDGHQGMDSQWHARLMDAAICFHLIPAPPRYEVP